MNTTTSFVDQNQTYTSHASHQVFLREYENRRLETRSRPAGCWTAARPADRGRRDRQLGGSQGAGKEMLGINLTDRDVHSVPLMLTDEYGKFIPVVGCERRLCAGPGYAGADVISEGTPGHVVGSEAQLVGLSTCQLSTVMRTGHAFLERHRASRDSRASFDTEPQSGDTRSWRAPQTADARSRRWRRQRSRHTYDDEMLRIAQFRHRRRTRQREHRADRRPRDFPCRA